MGFSKHTATQLREILERPWWKTRRIHSWILEFGLPGYGVLADLCESLITGQMEVEKETVWTLTVALV